MRHAIVAALTAAAWLTALATASEAQPATRTIAVEQQAPTLIRIDLHEPGYSHGDMLAFEAAITADDGSAGVLHGILITVDIPDGADLFEDRIGQLVFDLGKGDSIAVAGASVYSATTAEMNADQP